MFMFQERKQGLRPLNGKELLLGAREGDGESADTLLKYWMTQGITGERMIRASTGRAIAALYNKEVPPLEQPQRGPHNMWLWLCNLPEKLVGPVVADMEETIPDWLDYFRAYGGGEFNKRIPLNRSEITAIKEHTLRADQGEEEAEQDWRNWQRQQSEDRQRAEDEEREKAAGADPFAFLDKGLGEEQ
jgi:hypothetical protein